MSEPYVGEIRRFPYGTIPDGWLACDGQVLPADQYPSLYKIITNTYGGIDGSTFALPNLQGCVAVGQGGSAGALGQSTFAPGPAAAFQIVFFAIAMDGLYPNDPQEK
jgi:microcystin-dependent protein